MPCCKEYPRTHTPHTPQSLFWYSKAQSLEKENECPSLWGFTSSPHHSMISSKLLILLCPMFLFLEWSIFFLYQSVLPPVHGNLQQPLWKNSTELISFPTPLFLLHNSVFSESYTWLLVNRMKNLRQRWPKFPPQHTCQRQREQGCRGASRSAPQKLFGRWVYMTGWADEYLEGREHRPDIMLEMVKAGRGGDTQLHSRTPWDPIAFT